LVPGKISEKPTSAVLGGLTVHSLPLHGFWPKFSFSLTADGQTFLLKVKLQNDSSKFFASTGTSPTFSAFSLFHSGCKMNPPTTYVHM
jgi:hypothetical protein